MATCVWNALEGLQESLGTCQCSLKYCVELILFIGVATLQFGPTERALLGLLLNQCPLAKGCTIP